MNNKNMKDELNTQGLGVTGIVSLVAYLIHMFFKKKSK